MSLEATAYVQAALGLYLSILCFYLLYDYYQSVYKLQSSAPSKGPFTRHILCLFICFTVFTFLSSFFIAFLYNNAFNLVHHASILNAYCLTIMNMNIFCFYLQTIAIFLILSFFIQNTLSIANSNNSNYDFSNAYHIYYRAIAIVLNLYSAVHICAFMHKENIFTNTEWANSSNSFVLCELYDDGAAHIALIVIFEIMLYAVTIIPLIHRYKKLLSDHKDKNKKDDNGSYIFNIQMVIFYSLIQICIEIISFAVFIAETRVSGFVLIMLSLMRTTCIYCIFKETKSFLMFYKWPIAFYLLIWHKISPLTDPSQIDPNWRWYHKQKKSVDANNENAKIATRALSSGAVLPDSCDKNIYQIAEKEDIDINDEFNDENSVAFSGQSNDAIIDPAVDKFIIDDLDNFNSTK